MTARSILTISYGLEIGWSDPISDIAEACGTALFEAAVMPVTVLMDAFPLLQYLPSWMPGIYVLFFFIPISGSVSGGGFKHKLPQWKKASYEAYEVPFAAAEAACVCLVLIHWLHHSMCLAGSESCAAFTCIKYIEQERLRF